MSLGIYRVEEADQEELSYLVFEGFAENPVNRVIYPNGATRSVIEWNIAGDRRGLREDKHAHYLCVRAGPEDPIVSYALWYEYLRGEDADINTNETLECPPDSNTDAFRKLDPIGAQKRQSLMGRRPFMYLADLVTIPVARRQGAASLLLKWGMERAKAYGVPCYLQGSPEGSSLYRKYGFVEVDQVIIDLRPWKSPVPEVVNLCNVMVRYRRQGSFRPLLVYETRRISRHWCTAQPVSLVGVFNSLIRKYQQEGGDLVDGNPWKYRAREEDHWNSSRNDYHAYFKGQHSWDTSKDS